MITNTNLEDNLNYFNELTQNLPVHVKFVSESKGYGLFASKDFSQGSKTINIFNLCKI
jgi:hypothetical protein